MISIGFFVASKKYEQQNLYHILTEKFLDLPPAFATAAAAAAARPTVRLPARAACSTK